MKKYIESRTIEYLDRNKIFSKCSREDKIMLVQSASVRSFEKGQVIFSPSNEERCIGLVVQGSAAVSKGIDNQVIISKLQEGDMFGAVTLFSSYDFFVNTITAISGCVVLLFSYESVMQVMHKEPEVWKSYIQYLSDRIYFLNDRIDEFTASNIVGRLAMYIDEASNGRDKFKLNVSVITLSKQLDIGRSSLYRAFDRLEEIGAIKKDGKEIAILNREKLIEYEK